MYKRKCKEQPRVEDADLPHSSRNFMDRKNVNKTRGCPYKHCVAYTLPIGLYIQGMIFSMRRLGEHLLYVFFFSFLPQVRRIRRIRLTLLQSASRVYSFQIGSLTSFTTSLRIFLPPFRQRSMTSMEKERTHLL